MREVTMYKCGYCGRLFENEEQCIWHEETHPDMRQANIIEASFSNGPMVPVSISVEMRICGVRVVQKYVREVPSSATLER